MKVIIGKNDILPIGEYQLTDPSKLENAKGNIPFPRGDRRILIEYDRIGGRVIKEESVLPPQSLWNLEKNRVIEEYSDPEIIEVLRRAENTNVPGSLYQKARYEWEQRQQNKNLEQTASLIAEIRELKEVTKVNAETSTKDTKRANILASLAIIISVLGILAQVALDIERKDSCADFGGGNIRCTTWYDAGIFGTWVIPERSITK
ncbi:hypothetical protein K8Q93_03215 [Candidatus Parcubacteria bacterium]|nr:hypothetical protein [Candidatus Parcubacteria bacterium]